MMTVFLTELFSMNKEKKLLTKRYGIAVFFLILCINVYADEKIQFPPEINPFAYIYDEEKDSSGIMHYEYIYSC